MAEQSALEKLQHECFPQPPDPQIRVWRYLDLAKFVWLLSNRKLWLSRIDLLQDSYEGTTPRILVAARDQYFKSEGLDNIAAQWPGITQRSRTATYASCWHSGNAESEAMWRLYCPSNEGVAIQTTYQKLVDSIADDRRLYIGLVTYLDYESQMFPLNNFFYHVMHKRISFEHEREVRLVKTLFEFMNPDATGGPVGIAVDWDIQAVVEAIYVDPYAPPYFADVVQKIVKGFAPNLEQLVRWSQMRADPMF